MLSLYSTVLFNQSINHTDRKYVGCSLTELSFSFSSYLLFLYHLNTHLIRKLKEKRVEEICKEQKWPIWTCARKWCMFNIHTELDDDASSCCWKWWKAIRSFLVRSVVVGPVVFVLLLLRLPIPGDGAVANIVGL